MLDKVFSKIERFVPKRWRWILSNYGFKRYFANTGWMYFEQVFAALVSFFIGAWIARYLGPTNYGSISYVIAFVGLFAFISTLGVDSILNRDLVRYPEKRDSLLGTAFFMKLVGGLIAFAGAGVGSLLIKTTPLIRLLIIVYASYFTFQSLNVIATFFQANVWAKENARIQVMADVISAILKICLIVFGLGIFWLTLIYVLDVVWRGIGMVMVYREKGLHMSAWSFDWRLANNLFKDSWPLIFSGAAIFIYARIDQVIIGQLMNTTELGFYSAAVRVTEALAFVPGVINLSLFPAIINAKRTSEDMYKRRLRNFYLLILAVVSCLVVPIFLLAKYIIYFLFGHSYLPAVSVLQIYIWSSIGMFLGAAVTQYLITENKTITIFMVNALTAIVNIILNLILIPRIGLAGAAIATLAASFLIPAYVFIFVPPGRGKRVKENYQVIDYGPPNV